MHGFGTHNGWLAFRGWLGAKIYGAPVTWKITRSPYMKTYHVVKVGEEW